MNKNQLLAALFFLAALTIVPAHAQQATRGTAAPATRGATTTAAAPATAAASTTVNIPDSKIAYINTEAFGAETGGITRYVNAVRSLDREFKPRQDELTNLSNQIKAIADDINKTQSVADPKALQSKQDRGETLQRELEFKKKNYDADAQKRYTEVVSPISEDIGKSLDAFARAHNITLLFDISKMAPAVLTANPAMDVTAAFIAEYNSRNPR